MALVESQPTNGCGFANMTKLMAHNKSSCQSYTKNLKRSAIEAPEIVKNERMDPARQKQCSLIMKKLMNHASGHPSKQLDLSSIQRKLDCKAYPTTSRFAADVMRILHNAMQDTPPTDIVHIMAKELNDIFNENWKKKNVWWIDVPTAPPPQKKHKAETVKTKSANAPVQNPCNAKKRQQLKTNRSAVKKSNLEVSESKDGAAVSERNYQQIPHQAASEPGISKKNIQRSSVKDPCTTKIEQPLHAHQCPVNSTTLEPCKDGVATSEDNTRSIKHHASSLAGAGKGPHNYPSEEQFSPSKALHVKVMKSRYADIIKKTQQTLQLDGVQTDNKVEMQLEKQDLEKLDQKEKPKFENESKMQREKKREAARIALNKMESKLNEDLERETQEIMKIMKYGCKTVMEKLGLFLKEDGPGDTLDED